ncbi:MAG TPA: hypothetical protein VFT45_21690 [Longimicrobium sp.]|nr:hypothetical protein [Longimicrobium sp.]
MSSQEPRTYPIGDGPVTLEVLIGEGQKGRIAVLLNGAEVARGDGHVRKILGAQLDGAVVEIFSVVSHTNPQSTRISVTHTWSGGPAPQQDVDSGDFATDGDPAFVEPTYHLLRTEQP